MYFGFCNAPSTFQTMMNAILEEEIRTGKVVVYIEKPILPTMLLEQFWNNLVMTNYGTQLCFTPNPLMNMNTTMKSMTRSC